jgi:hypothetical protein
MRLQRWPEGFKSLGNSLSTTHAGMPMCAALNDLQAQVLIYHDPAGAGLDSEDKN